MGAGGVAFCSARECYFIDLYYLKKENVFFVGLEAHPYTVCTYMGMELRVFRRPAPRTQKSHGDVVSSCGTPATSSMPMVYSR